MKTCVVLSDTHARCKKELDRLLPLFAENDFIIHLGDGSADMRGVFSEYPKKTYLLKGNCDFSYGQEELVLEAEGMRILCCHGHRYGVKSGRLQLFLRAKELDCDVALYGHTHTACIEEKEGILLVNPGALSNWTQPSYCYLVLHDHKATATIVNL